MNAKHYLAAVFAFLTVFALIACPEATFDASVRGLNLWWNIVFPALLPFFVAAELLTGLGAVHFIGVLLEPLMRPLFRVPGVGGFIMAAGLASGFPMGAMLTAEYRQKKALSKEEGERLMAFANTAGPLFMTGAVATGMLGWPQIGMTIILVHYLSSLSTGLLMRFYKPNAIPSSSVASGEFILARAARALVEARRQDGRPFSKLLGDAVAKAVSSLLLVGGFIISFSVLIELLNTSGLAGWLASAISVEADIVKLISTGALELTNGCRQAAQSTLPMTGKIIAISAMIAWSGMSVHGQAASFASKTDMSIRPFLFARGIHACLAAMYAALLIKCNWIPTLPAAAIEYVSLGLGAKYLFSLANLAGILLLWAGAGFGLMLITTILRLKLLAFRVNQPRR